MLWLFGLVGVVLIVAIGLVVLGRETERLASAPRPAVYDMAQAVDFIADRLPPSTQARISHADVRWVLVADADLLEAADLKSKPHDADDETGDDDDDLSLDGAAAQHHLPGHSVDQDAAIARILALADASGREMADEDVAAVLDVRMDYLRAIGAIGPRA